MLNVCRECYGFARVPTVYDGMVPCSCTKPMSKEAIFKKALERLGSMEAFTVPTVLEDGPIKDELVARIEYARKVLQDND